MGVVNSPFYLKVFGLLLSQNKSVTLFLLASFIDFHVINKTISRLSETGALFVLKSNPNLT
jgi:flagellar biosynthesis component FlhA